MFKIFVSCLLLLGLPLYAAPLFREIQEQPRLRTAVCIVAKRCYGDSSDIHRDVRTLPNQPAAGTALIPQDMDLFFHDLAGHAQLGYVNSFRTAGIGGCIYSVQSEDREKEIFIAFPGTQTVLEWAKNFFGIIAPSQQNNIQSSYDDDIRTVFSDQSDNSFLKALAAHINSLNSNYRDNNNINNDPLRNLPTSYKFTFVGHSRGGGLALLAARRFLEQFNELSVRVVTFCAPRLTNAPVEQVRFVSTLGFLNMVHFTRRFDLAPQFPFGYLDNLGVHIPLNARKFWRPIDAHNIPSTEELRTCVDTFNVARGVGVLAPVYNLIDPDPKAILWAAGGAIVSYYFMNKKDQIIDKLIDIFLD